VKRIFTDGACSGNPGPGGWAFIVLHDNDIETISGGTFETTNNRMELTAIVESLRYICLKYVSREQSEKDFCIVSDSAYVINAVNSHWIMTWKSNGWKTTKGKTVKNRDLWQDFLRYLSYMKKDNMKVTFEKVKGHSGNSFNEMVDMAARTEVDKIIRGVY
jgi:ribonuclease HI